MYFPVYFISITSTPGKPRHIPGLGNTRKQFMLLKRWQLGITTQSKPLTSLEFLLCSPDLLAMADLFLFFFRRLRSVTKLAGDILIYWSFFLAFLASPGTALSLRWACDAWGSTPRRAACMAKAQSTPAEAGARLTPRECAGCVACSSQALCSLLYLLQPTGPQLWTTGQELARAAQGSRGNVPSRAGGKRPRREVDSCPERTSKAVSLCFYGRKRKKKKHIPGSTRVTLKEVKFNTFSLRSREEKCAMTASRTVL